MFAPSLVRRSTLVLRLTCTEALSIAKITNNALVPLLKPLLTTGPLKGKVQLLVRLQVQPWFVLTLNSIACYSSPIHLIGLIIGTVLPFSHMKHLSQLAK